ncbi:MAG: hypothetical protein J6K25_11120 [Thermoguttaceae bacterium]|nr:hypothetical protein [Thermoguttaceae bacterium]
MEKTAARNGARNWRKTTAKSLLWGVAAASAACVASFSLERTLDEVAGAVEATFPASSVEEAERVAPASPSERLLREAIARLEGLRSVSADLDFEARLFGERYFGRGRYEETSEASASSGESAARRSTLENVRYRLRASVARGSAKEARDDGEENVLEIVCDCDRQALWTYTSLEGAKSLTRIDVAELSNGLASLSPEELAAVGVEGPCAMNGLPGLGGLAGTLRRLTTVYRFEPRIERAEPFKGAEVVKITGRAREAFWKTSKQRLGVDKFEPYLNENLPGNVEIYFGVDWPFPYKIVYFSLAENEEKTRNDIFTVEYSTVVRNDATIRPENFNYNQPQSTFERVTSKYVEGLIAKPE